MSSSVSRLPIVEKVLAAGGFQCELREMEGLGQVLLAETPLALVMAIDSPLLQSESILEDAQARLTTLAAAHPSPRSWDLYLVIVEDETDEEHSLRSEYEADTRYARKLFVRTGSHRIEMELRCLLPLRALPEIEISDSLAALKARLVSAGIPTGLADASIRSFKEGSEVEIP